jgi:hypothetical protein
VSYDPTNRGALFRNDKGGNEKRPDYSGELNVDGRELRISGWLREAKDGRKFMSLAVSPKDAHRVAAQPKPAAAKDPDDDIPF